MKQNPYERAVDEEAQRHDDAIRAMITYELKHCPPGQMRRRVREIQRLITPSEHQTPEAP